MILDSVYFEQLKNKSNNSDLARLIQPVLSLITVKDIILAYDVWYKLARPWALKLHGSLKKDVFR